MKKWDFCLGNPPYQISQTTNNRQEPVYPYFYNAAENIADKYVLISPARFLFNAGLTSKDWNKKMLDDKHIKVMDYCSNATEIFPNTDIKGGVAVVYRDSTRIIGPIDRFIPDENLRNIFNRFLAIRYTSLSSIMFGGRSDLKFNNSFLVKYPNSKKDRLIVIQRKHPEVTELGPNEEYELKSSTFESLSYVFYDTEPANPEKYYKLLGLENNKRTFKWIERVYMTPRYPDNNNIEKYKAFIPKASGNGQFGETLSAFEVGIPGESATPSFISVGNFSSETEALNVIKYMKSKLVRALLGILKITQDITPEKWKYVPLQDFTKHSDIDWDVSIHNIDKQLYKKYGLSNDEINYIEVNVKEME